MENRIVSPEPQACGQIPQVLQKRENGWNQLLNLLFPRKCAGCGELLPQGALCAKCISQVRLLEEPCRTFPESSPLESMTACFSYSSAGAALMREFKFRRQKHCYELVLREPFEQCIKAAYGGVQIDMVAPVPMLAAAKNKRGFNQAEYIAQRLAKQLNVPYRLRMLRKIRKNEVQHSLSAAQRAQNVKGIYQVGLPVAGKTVLVVDDITTTGSTLAECADVLRSAGAARVLGAAVMSAPLKKEFFK